jgi:GLPGLI family protein
MVLHKTITMKRILVAAALVLSASTYAQINQGRASYDLKFSSDDPQTSAYISQMQGSTLEIYFMGDKSRTEMYMGEFMTNITLMEKGKDTVITLIDGMMGKIAMKTTENDLDDEQRLAMSERKIELVNETKEIMGYSCKKAIITTTDGNESIVWYTPEIVPQYRAGQYLYEEIPGLPLEMSANWGNMSINCVAFEFNKKIKKPEKLFVSSVPDGYTIRTAEEMKQMRRGR